MQPSQFQTDLATATTNSKNQDRATVLEYPQGLLLIIADGAGGMGGGAEAAELVIQIVKEMVEPKTKFSNSLIWQSILQEADTRLLTHPIAGETTAVIAAISNNIIYGASVGDSGAFLIQQPADFELTAQQQRKPFLGSGIAIPSSYGPIPFYGTLLLATDGLIKYAPMTKIHQIVLNNPIESVAQSLIESIRYPSGNLPDDVSIIVCKKKDECV
jgi:PPM family protein phosphatase